MFNLTTAQLSKCTQWGMRSLAVLASVVVFSHAFSSKVFAQTPCDNIVCESYCGSDRCNTRLYCEGTSNPASVCQCYDATECANGSFICSGSCPGGGSPGGGGGGSCGDGVCAVDESCGSCESDCGSCGGGGGGAYCGDSSCNNGENCSSCATDCGSCCATTTAPVFTNLVNSQWNVISASLLGQPGDYGYFEWNNVPGAVRYIVMIDDHRDGWAGYDACQNGTQNPYDYCNFFTNGNYWYGQVAVNNTYGINVYPVNSCGQVGPVAYTWVWITPVSCTPTCTGELCGQSDGCGGVCSNADDLTPPAPTLVSPASESQIVPTNSSSGGVPTKAVTLQVRNQSNPTYDPYYTRIEVYPVGTNCSHSLADCQIIGSNITPNALINFTYHIPVSQYGSHVRFQWRAYHQNNTCSDQSGPFTGWRYFELADNITGFIYRDDGAVGLSGGVCTSPFSPVSYTPEAGDAVRAVRGGTTYTGTLNANGSYSILVPVSSTGQNTVSFRNTDNSQVCGCPNGCSYAGVDSPETNLNFYYQAQDIRDPWWQTIAGSVYAGRTTAALSVQSRIPETCFGTCEPFLSLRNSSDTSNSSGVVITGGGSVDAQLAAGNQTSNIDEDGRNIRVVGTTTEALLENYDYFYRLYSMGVSPANDLNTPANKPTGSPTNGRAFFRNGNLAINNAWSVGSSESIVIFVDGDLTINNTISVAQGGFLAFIVDGSITFASSICQSDPESISARVAGVFIADGTLTVAGDGNGDCKFVAEGIFAAHSGINLNRDFRDGATTADFLNARNPVEVFIYRPDFVRNIPARMTRPFYQWQEVAP